MLPKSEHNCDRSFWVVRGTLFYNRNEDLFDKDIFSNAIQHPKDGGVRKSLSRKAASWGWS